MSKIRKKYNEPFKKNTVKLCNDRNKFARWLVNWISVMGCCTAGTLTI